MENRMGTSYLTGQVAGACRGEMVTAAPSTPLDPALAFVKPGLTAQMRVSPEGS
jgi:hypothetical protein